MRLLHTSDWHLGHTLHEVPRDHEHDRFLAWLLDTLEARAVDALLITGDVFDSANPPARAQRAWYEFLARARQLVPHLQIVVIGGNHDSPARLDAPAALLEAHAITVVGGLPRTDDGAIDVERCVVTLRDRAGAPRAVVAAVPYLRVADLPRAAEDDGAGRDPLIEGVRAVYDEVLVAARERAARAAPGDGPLAVVATGHCYMVGTSLSYLSERRILGGNQHALPHDIFPRDIAYGALGHLHKAQRVARREGLRYAGSPIPLAMNEADYRHQVLLVELDGGELAGVESVPVPRTVPVLRVPRRGAIALDEVADALAALPPWPELSDEGDGAVDRLAARPHLEVCVALSRPEPRLRQLVEDALVDRWPRLLKLSVEYTGDGAPLAEGVIGVSLRDLDPREVFLRRYLRDHDEPPAAELLEAFDELLDEAREELAR